MTRILSAFNLLKRVGFAFLLLGGYITAMAQPPDTLWHRSYEASSWMTPRSAMFAGSNLILVSGSVLDVHLGQGLFLLEADTLGNFLDIHVYRDDLLDVYAGYLVRAADGGYFLAGFTPDPKDFYIFKLDSARDLEWQSRIVLPYNQELLSVAATSDTGAVLGGYTRYPGQPNRPIMMRLSSDGDTVWTRVIDQVQAGLEGVTAIQCTPEGEIFFAGSTDSIGTEPDEDIFLGKANLEGELLGLRRLGRSHTDYCNDLLLSNGRVILAGQSVNPETNHWEAYLVEADSLLDTLWTRTYSFGSGHYSDAVHIVSTPDGGFVFAGSSNFNTIEAVTVARVSPIGEEIWDTSYLHYDHFVGISMGFAMDDQERFVVSRSFFNELHLAFTESGRLSVPNRDRESIAKDLFISAYPNPFNAQVEIEVELGSYGKLDVCIVNTLGQTVQVLHSKISEPGKHRFSWNGVGRSSGRYYVVSRSKFSEKIVGISLVK